MLIALTLACAPDPETDGDDTAAASTTPTVTEGSEPAPLTKPSSGECPDLSATGTSTFLSSGEERTVTVAVPDPAPEGELPLVIFFHGLLDSSTPSPGEEFADALDFQGLANETGSIIVAPDSRIMDLFGLYEVWLWDLLREDDHDQVLFDDLRSCAAAAHPVDLHRVVAAGFSGGALFTTVILSDRGDTLATAIEMSGGSDVDTGFFDAPLSVYTTPAEDFPVLLVSGGESDVWPDPQLAVVDFVAATDTLQEKLLVDEHFVVRCGHDRGHTVTNQEWNLAVDWALAHTFGEPSPWADGDLGGDADWCTIPAAGGTE